MLQQASLTYKLQVFFFLKKKLCCKIGPGLLNFGSGWNWVLSSPNPLVTPQKVSIWMNYQELGTWDIISKVFMPSRENEPFSFRCGNAILAIEEGYPPFFFRRRCCLGNK